MITTPTNPTLNMKNNTQIANNSVQNLISGIKNINYTYHHHTYHLTDTPDQHSLFLAPYDT